MAASRLMSGSLMCESHPDAELIEDHRAGDTICSECGIVVGDRVIDVCSEWRTFANANDKETKDMCRVGAAEDPNANGADLSTTIGRATGSAGFDENGRPIYKNRSFETSADKARRTANREINEMAVRLSVDHSIISCAQHVYFTVQKDKLVKGRANDAIIAACMYIACRQESVPRTFKEICAVSNSSKKDIGRCYKLIRKKFESNVATISSTDFITRFCSKLNLTRVVQKLAEHISSKAMNIDTITGRCPTSLAAAAIYLAADLCGTGKSYDEIGKMCGAAENTVKATCKLLQPNMSQLLPVDFKPPVKPVSATPLSKKN